MHLSAIITSFFIFLPRNRGRAHALRLCGWETDRESKSFEAFIQRLLVDGDFERAAAIAVFNLHLKLAVEILQIADHVYAGKQYRYL